MQDCARCLWFFLALKPLSGVVILAVLGFCCDPSRPDPGWWSWGVEHIEFCSSHRASSLWAGLQGLGLRVR